MDISQYRADTLLGPRDANRDPPKGPISEISAISGHPEQTGQDEGYSLFDAVLDTVNPLQHIPGVSSVYRATTGDESSALANMAGGFLFGGPVGLAAGAATSFFEMLTGRGLMDHAMALFTGDQDSGGLEHMQTVAEGGASGLTHLNGLSLEQYQAFALAQAEQNSGTGAELSQVSWSSNIWTANALKEATGLYENNDKLGESASAHKKQSV